MAEKIKVLAVDDEKFNLMLLKGCLKSDTYEITGCTNAVEALQEFKKQFFDVVLLDVLMPGIDGFELRKLIRQLDAERPIIFLTALVDDINTTMLNQISWDSYTYYMNKSFSKKLLSSKIQQAVGVYRSRKMVADYYHKLEDEMGLAGDIQRILLPNWCELYDNAMLCSYYAPCSKVSGDLFDFFPIPDGRYMLFLGDIAGHGMQAALYMAAVQSYIKVAVARGATEPHELLNELNDFFCEELGTGTYMTCLAAVFDFKANTLTVQSAGHPGLLGCRCGSDKVLMLGDSERGGLPIGWFASTKYQEEDTTVHKIDDDTVVLGYTDGILDVCDREKQTMDEGEFLSMIGALASSSDAATMPYRLRTALGQMGYDQSPDDICIVAIKKIPESQPNDIRRIIQPKLPNVSETAIEFSGMFQKHGGSLEMTTRLELLISEYLNNVIIHGSEGNSKNRQPIYLEMHVDDEKMVLRGLDRGKSWDLDTGDTGDQDTSSLSIPTSGRGLQIIKDITDHVTHSNYCGLNETVFFVNIKK